MLSLEEQPTAFDALRALDRMGRAHPLDLTVDEGGESEWYGVAVRFSGRHFLLPMHEVAEVMPCPPLTPVPHTRDWVKGVANVRGTLIPVIDLDGFFGQGPVNMSHLTRIVIMRAGEVVAGLLVDEVLGLRPCARGGWLAQVPGGLSSDLARCIAGVFQREDGDWPVFRPVRLVRDPRFMRVAA
ncbi:CheW protein [Alkalilimnicola ehrlichii MLHE-1]|uniref:CheW protein n=1 Tax=Alkalilimnicola ehrlichii (strain ATCC BAA-1101 / DSM 17681 / MLHE-1) TaxID=187272 RepID=Q0ABS5_ALKEH|nr:CheW protein [Alkalilimnicola ehrlichii MLHE-1]